MRVVLASNNAKKLAELRALFAALPVELVPQNELGITEAEEPHVTWDQVAARAEGLILLSGGPDGPVDCLFAAGKVKEGRAALAEMKRVFADRFYVKASGGGGVTPAEMRAAVELFGRQTLAQFEEQT